MTWPLFRRLPSVLELARIKENKDQDALANLILDRFLDYIQEKGLELYPAQEEAILDIFSGKNVILNTPTGSGKSLVALALHFYALIRERRSFYTSPIKALVNEKFFALCRDFGPEQVGMITGDASVNPQAPIICCTAEILAIDSLREGPSVNIQDVVMDEFHYYSDRERGVAWQIPLLTLSYARFLLMSATMGDSERFEKVLTNLTGLETTTVQATTRPVPLDYQYSENPLHETVAQLVANGRAPIYLVNFTQRECADEAQNFMSVDLCTKAEKQAIAAALVGFRFSSPYGKELQKFIKHGMGVHHGGLLPKYRLLVEKLAQQGLLKIIFGTDTLGVGVNVPIRTVLFTKLCKFDGSKTTILSVRDFKQISGRAGRKGFDDQGTVVVQAPEHVIENKRNELKAAGDPKKLKKLVRKKPPEKGFLMWSKETFQRLIDGKSEALVSRFQVNHAMLLNVLSRPGGDGCRALKRLIHDSHENSSMKKGIRDRAFQMFRSLAERKIIEFHPLRVNVDLQEDFSLNHALSLYLLDTIQQVDPKSLDYALDVLTLAESILENPDIILRKQLDRLKSEKMVELKMQGMEFDERIAELEKLEHPKPNRDFIYSTFNEFADRHPWIDRENIRPKSVAREIYTGFYSFTEYIREYELQRAEGVLLRYLSDVYKVILQNVPLAAQNEALNEIIIYIGGLVRQIDSSLLDEWEMLKNPNAVKKTLESRISDGHGGLEVDGHGADAKEAGGQGSSGIGADETALRLTPKALRVMVRNEVFRFVKALARENYEDAIECLTLPQVIGGADLPELNHLAQISEILQAGLKKYSASGHNGIRIDPEARGIDYFQVQEQTAIWKVSQVLLDAEGATDWAILFEVDVVKSKLQQRPALSLISFASL
jgi:superfamily II RNA helicase